MSKPGYQHLLTYQQLEEIYDLTNQFCKRFLPGRENLRLREQIIHAARSAKQCLVEGYEQESLKGYIKLTGVSRGSLKELLEDYKDFARNHQIGVWGKGDKRVREMLGERRKRKRGVQWILPFTPSDPLNPLYPINYLLNLVNMTTYLLDRQINSLKEKFVKEGGWTETMFKKRLVYRQKQKGFTLIEILIALTILVVVTGGLITIPVIRQAWKNKSKNHLDSQPKMLPTLQISLSPTPVGTPPDFLDWWSKPDNGNIEKDYPENDNQQGLEHDEGLLKILSPKEKAALENAIRQAQQVLQNIKVFNFSLPTTEDIKKGLNQINRQAPKQTPTLSQIDPKEIEEYFKQNPPAVPHKVKNLPPEAQEYYYRKYILKDPAFQY